MVETHQIFGGNVFALRKLSAVALAIPLALGGAAMLAAPAHAAGAHGTELPPPPPPPPDSMRPPVIGAPPAAGDKPYEPPMPVPIATIPPPAPGSGNQAPVNMAPPPVPSGNNISPGGNSTPQVRIIPDTPSGETAILNDQGVWIDPSSGNALDIAAIDAANEAAARSNSTPDATSSASAPATKAPETEAEKKAAQAALEREAVAAANRAKASASPSASPSVSETHAAYTPNLVADPSSANKGIDSGIFVLIGTVVAILIVAAASFFVWKKFATTKQAVDPRRRMRR